MNDNEGTILVRTAESVETRRRPTTQLTVDELSVNVNLFLQQLSGVLDKAPESVGKFHLAELEVHAEISAKGQLVVLGTGGEVGATGGLKFVFKRS